MLPIFRSFLGVSSARKRLFNTLTTSSASPGLAYPIENGVAPFLSPAAIRILHNDLFSSLLSRINALHPTPSSILDIARNSTHDPVLRQYAMQTLNVDLFLHSITPNPESPSSDTITRINAQFGNMDSLRMLIEDTAMGIFGNGYVWLCEKRREKTLHVIPTFHVGSPFIRNIGRQEHVDMVKKEKPLDNGTDASIINQDETVYKPLLALSLWEHAYILDYGVLGREKYVRNFWNVVDWKQVRNRMSTSMS